MYLDQRFPYLPLHAQVEVHDPPEAIVMDMMCWAILSMVMKDVHPCVDTKYWAALRGPNYGCVCNDLGHMYRIIGEVVTLCPTADKRQIGAYPLPWLPCLLPCLPCLKVLQRNVSCLERFLCIQMHVLQEALDERIGDDAAIIRAYKGCSAQVKSLLPV